MLKKFSIVIGANAIALLGIYLLLAMDSYSFDFKQALVSLFWISPAIFFILLILFMFDFVLYDAINKKKVILQETAAISMIIFFIFFVSGFGKEPFFDTLIVIIILVSIFSIFQYFKYLMFEKYCP